MCSHMLLKRTLVQFILLSDTAVLSDSLSMGVCSYFLMYAYYKTISGFRLLLASLHLKVMVLVASVFAITPEGIN